MGMNMKIVYVNQNGTVELTPNELEEMLNEAFEEGRRHAVEQKSNESSQNSKTSKVENVKNQDERKNDREFYEISSADFNKAVESLNSLMRDYIDPSFKKPKETLDVFTKLGKELNF